MISQLITANEVLKLHMRKFFELAEEAGMFRQEPTVITGYDKALAAQKASKEAAENKP